MLSPFVTDAPYNPRDRASSFGSYSHVMKINAKIFFRDRSIVGL